MRDQDGRTYAAAAVALPSLQVAALDLAVAMAASSGARSLEAGAVVGGAVAGGPVPGIDAVRDLSGSGVDVVIADEAGLPIEVLST